eukprot:gene56206-77044_t
MVPSALSGWNVVHPLVMRLAAKVGVPWRKRWIAPAFPGVQGGRAPPPNFVALAPQFLRPGQFCSQGPRQPMIDRPPYGPANPDPDLGGLAEIDAATRRLMAALDALESATERRREADRDEDELATRIQALGADRSRLADELDGTLVKSRRLERANREIAGRLDAAIGTIRSVLDAEQPEGDVP